MVGLYYVSLPIFKDKHGPPGFDGGQAWDCRHHFVVSFKYCTILDPVLPPTKLVLFDIDCFRLLNYVSSGIALLHIIGV